ncbi:TonB-dependent receptor [Pseudomonas fluorescens]|uniref:Uncharacterized protein n=1 Tax=Pseudomonas fluorescens TaxID=294 RepID=A0A5E7FI28_PSEFL|nr:TonB-dependent receptor [Pseudomonas fluorescens]VVO38432.1 hypothetical protein PS723_05590 [Pseudomonas fluorescens]
MIRHRRAHDACTDDTWSVALNDNNLFDKRYYATIGSETFGNYYGDPRNFKAV